MFPWERLIDVGTPHRYPLRNAVRTKDATIWSIASQLGNIDIHYHIQDDGSTDGKLEAIKFWAVKIETSSMLLPARVHFNYAREPLI